MHTYVYILFTHIWNCTYWPNKKVLGHQKGTGITAASNNFKGCSPNILSLGVLQINAGPDSVEEMRIME